MPLVWAHAEYVKLRRSLRDGAVFDLPPQTVKRYLVERTVSPRMLWRFNQKIRTLRSGCSAAHRDHGTGRGALDHRRLGDNHRQPDA